MAHEVFGQRFYSYRVPAWHNLVAPSDEELTAEQAIRRVAGDVQYSLEPLHFTVGEQTVRTDQNAIVRHPTVDDDQYRTLGVVTGKYHLVTPERIAAVWDARVDAKVETAGVLKFGAEVFLTTKMPSWEVTPGDTIDQYMIVRAPMDGKSALEVRQAPVRVVCANTLTLSDRLAVDRYAVPHLQNAEAELAHVFDRLYGLALAKQAIIKEAYSVLAAAHLDGDDHARKLLDTIYPEPVEPTNADGMIPASKFAAAHTRYMGQVRTRSRKVDGTMRLWRSDGGSYNVTGGEFASMDGTAWRLYQCVTELENWSWYSTPAGRASSVLYGSRGQTMAHAFDVLATEAATIANHKLDFLN